MSNPIQKKINSKRRGQGMTEYVIIVAMIAIAAIGIVTFFGQNIRQIFSASGNALAGTSAPSGATTTATSTTKNLKTFAVGN